MTEKKTEKKTGKPKSSKKKDEKPAEEKTYLIPLREVTRASVPRRANRAIKAVRGYLEEKAGLKEYAIDPKVNHALWAGGTNRPPRSIKVKVVKTDEKTTVTMAE